MNTEGYHQAKLLYYKENMQVSSIESMTLRLHERVRLLPYRQS